jgi:protein-tyrosine-phosphatase
MAAEIFKKAIWEYDIFKRLNWRFDSAGTGAVSGERATLRARKAMKEIGLNIDNHRSRNIDAVNLKEYDLVLIMEERQRDAILHIQPQMVDRLWLLSQYAGFGGDIADPILSRNYAACVDKLEGCSDAIARRILERIPSSIESIDNMRIRWLIVPEIVNCGHGVEFWYTKKPGSMKPQTVLGFIDGHDWSRRHGEIHVFILSHDSKIWNSLNVDPVPMIKDLKKCISLVFKGAGQEQLTPSIWAQING